MEIISMIAATCLALNIYMESRSEPTIGQRAVAQVTLRRAGSAEPNAVCGAVTQRSQFSWTSGLDRNGRDWDEVAFLKAQRIARESLLWWRLRHTPDHSNGATHYATGWIQPYWSKDMDVVARIGDHVFYKERQ